MAKRRGLGRGLDALLSTSDPSRRADGDSELRELPIELLRRGKYQPRLRMDPAALEELANSIRAQGVVQPIVVRPLDDESFEIVAGERRWRAAQAAGLMTVPAIVRSLGDDAALAMALIENIQREDLNPVDEARALGRLVDEFKLTHQAAAEAVGRSRASVSNLLRLLDLNEDVRKLMEDGELEMGHGRALLGLSGPAQSRAARDVVARKLSARGTEALVRRIRNSGDSANAPAPRGPAENPDVRRLERQLSDRLGAPVRIEHDARGRGRLVIRFASLEEFDGIVDRIR